MKNTFYVALLVLISFVAFKSAFAQGGDEDNPLPPTEVITDGRVAYLPLFYTILDEEAQKRFGVYLKTDSEGFIKDFENGKISVVMLVVWGKCLIPGDCYDNAGGVEIVDGEGYLALATLQFGCPLCETEWELPTEAEGETFVIVFGVRHVENMKFRYISYDIGEIWFDVFTWEEAKRYLVTEGIEVDPILYELMDGEVVEESHSGATGLIPTEHAGTVDDPIPVGESLLRGENSFTIHAVDIYPELYGKRYPTYCMLVEYHTDLFGETTDTSWVFLFDPITETGDITYQWGAWDPAYIEEDASVDYEYQALIDVEAQNRVDWFGVNCFQVFEEVEIGAISFPFLKLGNEIAFGAVFSLRDAPTIAEYTSAFTELE